MSHGPSDMRMPDAEWATQEVKDIILDAWRPDWTRPGHPKYIEQQARDPKAAEHAAKIAITLRDWEKPQVDQALAALEDAGYKIVKDDCETCKGEGGYLINPDYPMGDCGDREWEKCGDCAKVATPERIQTLFLDNSRIYANKRYGTPLPPHLR